MKKILFAITLLAFGVGLLAQDTDKELIQKVIQEAYVDGIQNRGDIETIRNGFDPGFELLGVRDNKLTKLTIGEWIANIEKSRQANPNPPEHLTTAKFLNIDVTGISAVAKIELYRQGKLIFTDYLSLYKFEEGWKIVNKIYHRH
jgi:hypothetical protein